ncbi:hypothetical protein [Enterococcus sp. AZ007]|uniref:hypothetical protein n=1 Tax=Enterococcus sp. AZ007 TaxID=2774839 RepID=UPI003F25F907
MNLLKLIKNNISKEWKATFNKNVDILNRITQKQDQKLTTVNKRLDNLVLKSGGESPNEVVDARVNNKAEQFDSLQSRLLAAEDQHDSDTSDITYNLENQKEQLDQLNDTIAELYGANGTTLSIYVSEKKGNDETGLGTEDSPFKTIQTAVNQVPLISRVNVTIFIDEGVYLEDIMVSNVAASRMFFRPIQDDSVLDGLTSDMPVKIRSIGFFYCSGYFQVRGIEFIDQANSAVFSGRKYSIVAEQAGYLAINHCSFKENVKSLNHRTIYAGGVSSVHVYGACTCINQVTVLYAYLMSQITFNSTIQGNGNGILALAEQGMIRGFGDIATTPYKTESTGLIITKGVVL